MIDIADLVAAGKSGPEIAFALHHAGSSIEDAKFALLAAGFDARIVHTNPPDLDVSERPRTEQKNNNMVLVRWRDPALDAHLVSVKLNPHQGAKFQWFPARPEPQLVS